MCDTPDIWILRVAFNKTSCNYCYCPAAAVAAPGSGSCVSSPTSTSRLCLCTLLLRHHAQPLENFPWPFPPFSCLCDTRSWAPHMSHSPASNGPFLCPRVPLDLWWLHPIPSQAKNNASRTCTENSSPTEHRSLVYSKTNSNHSTLACSWGKSSIKAYFRGEYWVHHAAHWLLYWGGSRTVVHIWSLKHHHWVRTWQVWAPEVGDCLYSLSKFLLLLKVISWAA